jgi:hypothetical protein
MSATVFWEGDVLGTAMYGGDECRAQRGVAAVDAGEEVVPRPGAEVGIVLAAAKVAFGSLFRGFGHRSSSFGRPIVFANQYSSTGIGRVSLGAPGRTSTTSSTLGPSTKDPPVAGHEWGHACHGSFCSPSVTKF